MVLSCVSVLINMCVIGTNFVIFILFHRSELPEGCIATGCLITHYAQLTYTYSRVIGAILSAIVGALFLVMISWLKKKKPQIGSKVKAIAEAIVLRAVIFELLCDFLPHVLDAILMSVTDSDPFGYIGPYSRVIMAIDLLLNSQKTAESYCNKTRERVAVDISLNFLAVKCSPRKKKSNNHTNVAMIYVSMIPKLLANCAAYGCALLNESGLVNTSIRTVGVILSAIVGALFLVMLSWLKKKKPQIGSKVKAIAEAVVLRAVIFGLICDFLPQALGIVIIRANLGNPLEYIGPTGRVIMAIDVLLNSITNRLVFIQAKKKPTTRITTVI
ncbi:hypothetical protein FO519_008683 [Halicephalobus sp. NKZ332]|nr:hypothetical protein FO519_008683 [Halicephalobus sp. NKZ332]